MPSIVGILLAAGEGSRFGGDKLLAPMPADSGAESPGVPLGAVAGSRLVDALPDAIAVVRPRDARLSACLSAVGLRVVRCANADEGMGASLACGVTAARDADGWVIALADMPWIASATIRAIAAALAGGADIAAPSYRGERGHPVGFARRHYGTLAARGEIGGDEYALNLLHVCSSL